MIWSRLRLVRAMYKMHTCKMGVHVCELELTFMECLPGISFNFAVTYCLKLTIWHYPEVTHACIVRGNYRNNQFPRMATQYCAILWLCRWIISLYTTLRTSTWTVYTVVFKVKQWRWPATSTTIARKFHDFLSRLIIWWKAYRHTSVVAVVTIQNCAIAS